MSVPEDETYKPVKTTDWIQHVQMPPLKQKGMQVYYFTAVTSGRAGPPQNTMGLDHPFIASVVSVNSGPQWECWDSDA